MSDGERQLLNASYHEAGHVIAAWEYDIPLEYSEILADGTGSTRIARTEIFFRRFREVSQETVRNDAMFAVCGRYGELLVGDGISGDWQVDNFLVDYLARRFALSVEELHHEAFKLIDAQVEAVARVASALRQKGHLNNFELSIMRMDWLARGKS